VNFTLPDLESAVEIIAYARVTLIYCRNNSLNTYDFDSTVDMVA